MIVIVDYGAGNLTSVARAVSYLGFESVITDDPKKIVNAERIIFPGVGAAGAAMAVMKSKGIDDALKQSFEAGIPMLGICVGCQIIMDKSEENNADCLGIIKGEAKAFPNNMTADDEISNSIKLDNGIKSDDSMKSKNSIRKDSSISSILKVPHMGWNGLNIFNPHPLLKNIAPDDEFYFVHSYFPVPVSNSNVYGQTDYGIIFASAIGQDTLFAAQFHLEKSGKPGLLILKNFCLWRP